MKSTRKNEGNSKRFILIATIISAIVLIGILVVIVLSLFIPKNNNLDSYSGIEKEVAKKALTQVNSTTGTVERQYSVSAIHSVGLEGKCNDFIGTPASSGVLPNQRYEATLTETGITGLFAPKTLIHVCIY